MTSDLCHEIINDSRFSVRLLSIRDVRNLNHSKLCSSLEYACRPGQDGSPRLQGLYVFGPSKSTPPAKSIAKSCSSLAFGNANSSEVLAILHSPAQDHGDAWWDIRGEQLRRPVPDQWARCLIACHGKVAFDAPLCLGPRHQNSPVAGISNLTVGHGPAVATYSLAGCERCGTAPEGMISPVSHGAAYLPLLAPPPVMSSSLRAATTPRSKHGSIVPRCAECISERYCHCCNKWWCEACYQLPSQDCQQEAAAVIKDGNRIDWGRG